MKVIITLTCEECCVGSVQRTCMHPCYVWAIWLKETHISDLRKRVKFDLRTTQGLMLWVSDEEMFEMTTFGLVILYHLTGISIHFYHILPLR